ncbi:hypothetical protein L596_022986 [Steinernema carpocapsae]|uniref:Thioesterase domain-containing protein n=1 Tax=Steinernema carpocapsae TaxID=34508 RepID=A0A4U5MC82_STECR|nr:hypothetical protein L596_022986 [Steinernema carpocapsae]
MENGCSSQENGCATVAADDAENLAFLTKMIDDYKAQENFNRVARKIHPISASKTSIVVEMTVEEEHVNGKGTLHGGQTASLVDIVTARAVGMSIRDRGMVSVELAVSYLLPAKLGETILIEGIVLKCGRNIAFTECEFRRKTDRALVAKGKHTIAFMHKPVPNQF